MLCHGLTHQIAPFYRHQNLNDAVLTFENDIYDGVTAYAIYYSNVTDTTAVAKLIEDEGFTSKQANNFLKDTQVLDRSPAVL